MNLMLTFRIMKVMRHDVSYLAIIMIILKVPTSGIYPENYRIQNNSLQSSLGIYIFIWTLVSVKQINLFFLENY